MMTKVVDMKEKIETRKQEEQLKKYRGRVETIQKILQCSSCHYRCAMCGQQVSGDDGKPHIGFSFCESCRSDFEEYLAISRGKKKPDVFWHNQEWLEIWRSWMTYRKAIDAFTASQEFKMLIEDMKTES